MIGHLHGGSGPRRPAPRIAGGLLAATLAGALLPEGASAANVTLEGDCRVRLSGVIEEGDAGKVEAALRERETDCPHTELQLDSPGGSVGEALRIAEGFGRTIPIVGDGDRCLSACALIFLAGRTCSELTYTCSPARRIHPGGTLGLHAPFLERDATDRLVPRALAFSEAVEVLSQILAAFEGFGQEPAALGYRGSLLPQELFTQMLITPPEDFYYIQTNDQFFRFDIEIAQDASVRGTLRREHLVNMCRNLVSGHLFELYGHIPGDTNPLTRFFERPSPYGNGTEIVLRFAEIHVGTDAESAWCVISEASSPAYRLVSVYPGSLTEPPSPSDTRYILAVMHVSMGFPIGTDIRATRDLRADPDALDAVHRYVDALGHDGEEALAHWIEERRAQLRPAVAAICDAELGEVTAFRGDDARARVDARLDVTACATGQMDEHPVRIDLLQRQGAWRIAAIRALSSAARVGGPSEDTATNDGAGAD